MDCVLPKQVWNAVTADNIGKVVVGGIASIHGESIATVSVGVSRIFSALLSGNADQAGVAVVARIRRKHRKVGITTPVEGQVLDKRSIQNSAAGRFGGPQQWGSSVYFNCVSTGSHLQ